MQEQTETGHIIKQNDRKFSVSEKQPTPKAELIWSTEDQQ